MNVDEIEIDEDDLEDFEELCVIEHAEDEIFHHHEKHLTFEDYSETYGYQPDYE